MKPNHFLISFSVSITIVSALIPAFAETAETSKVSTTLMGSGGSAVTNAGSQSIFNIPANPNEGRDPFFPNSRRFAAAKESTNSVPEPAFTVALLLQGISGAENNRLAIVNGRTLAEGEETELTVGNNRVHLRCIEIKSDSVTVEIGNVRRELRLRSTN